MAAAQKAHLVQEYNFTTTNCYVTEGAVRQSLDWSDTVTRERVSV